MRRVDILTKVMVMKIIMMINCLKSLKSIRNAVIAPKITFVPYVGSEDAI